MLEFVICEPFPEVYRMTSYSDEELVDVLIVCGAVDCNEHADLWLYQRRHSNRRILYSNYLYKWKQKVMRV
ncbi:hypothetical protein TNCV_151631 [Trichonephila clavipes]|uniref:Uncharacterized protein n=1 Tax=Trichonephila clavipes TaxID=2585209 RepID=A0A8X6RQJ4_TRICX|nr:hypothetical protein TNCV_151631 [Trichonephila clavipes]